jgi:hypothetical protein
MKFIVVYLIVRFGLPVAVAIPVLGYIAWRIFTKEKGPQLPKIVLIAVIYSLGAYLTYTFTS